MEATLNLEQLNFAKLKQASNIKNINPSNLEDKRLKEVCNDFESFFMQQLLEVSLKSTNVAGEGTGSEIIKGLYTENMTKNSGGSLGISDMLYKFLTEK